jgi:2-octaprenyl-6-methoxyphenol hydroxylase
VVAADGANSFIRTHLQIPTETRDYGQTAVICNITPEQAHAGRAFECLTSTGPFAVLPHTGIRCGLVWCVASDEARGLLELDDATFLGRAEERFGDHLGAFLKAGKRTAYPLKLVRAKEDVRDRLVILGNAAHAIHPVGAQGFNLALRDVAVLAEILADDENNDPGQRGLLDQYSRWRKQDQRGTIATSDGMTRLFAHPSMLAAGLRTSGLIAHALLPSLRRRSALQAMGYRGRVPRLALGEPLSLA